MATLEDYINSPMLKGQGSLREQALRLAEALSAPAKAIVEFGEGQKQKLVEAESLAKTFKGTSAEKHYAKKYGDELGGRVLMGVGNVNTAKLAREFANKTFKNTGFQNQHFDETMKAKVWLDLPPPNPSKFPEGAKLWQKKNPFTDIQPGERAEFLKATLSAKPSISMEQKPIISTLEEWNEAANGLMKQGYTLPDIIKHIGPVTSVPQTGPLKFPFSSAENAKVLKEYDPAVEFRQIHNIEPYSIPAALSAESGIHKLTESRARAAGYGVPVFKGMRYPIQGEGFRNPAEKGVEQGQFFTRSPYVANRYAEMPADYKKMDPRELQKYLDPEFPTQALPFWLKMEKPLMAGPRKGSVPYHNLPVDDIIRKARASGHDSAILRNVDDVGGISNQYVVFNSNQIRLPWARFQDTTSPNLLGARVPTAPRPQQPGPGQIPLEDEINDPRNFSPQPPSKPKDEEDTLIAARRYLENYIR